MNASKRAAIQAEIAAHRATIAMWRANKGTSEWDKAQSQSEIEAEQEYISYLQSILESEEA